MRTTQTNGREQIENGEHISRHDIGWPLWIFVLLTVFWINACNPGNAGQAPEPLIERENDMQPSIHVSNDNPGIPPMDAAQPAEISTATFAMG